MYMHAYINTHICIYEIERGVLERGWELIEVNGRTREGNEGKYEQSAQYNAKLSQWNLLFCTLICKQKPPSILFAFGFYMTMFFIFFFSCVEKKWPLLGVLLPAVLRWSFAPSSIWASLTLKGLMGNLCWGTWVPINQTEAESLCLFGALAWSPQATQRLFPMYTHSVLQSPWGWRYGFILGSSAPKCKDSVQGTYLQGSVTHAWASNSSKQMLAFYCRRPRSRKVNRASSHTSNEKSPYTSLGLLEFRI